MRLSEEPSSSFMADVDDTQFEVEFIDNRDLNGEWYCIITFGGKYISGESHPDKEQAFLFAIHNVLIWLHFVQVQLDDFWTEVNEDNDW